MFNIMSKRWKFIAYSLLGLLTVLVMGGFWLWRSPPGAVPEKISNYAILQQQSVTNSLINFRDYFAPTYPSNLYKPVATWTGRLILPTISQRNNKGVLFEVHNTDAQHKNLQGQVVNLHWSDRQTVAAYRQASALDISFTAKTLESVKSGNIHPDRLNGWSRVDALESLAGGRPKDDLIVKISPVEIRENTTLVIDSEPVQIVGSHYALIQIVSRDQSNVLLDSKSNSKPNSKPDVIPDGKLNSPQESKTNRFLVRHFNSVSKQFDGLPESILIPQVVGDRDGVLRSTNQELEKSPLNTTGWYIYGVKNAQGLFVVQALEPRSVLQVTPQMTKTTASEKANSLEQLWQNLQKGMATSVLLANQAAADWKVGDRAIVMHIFGGIGGKKAEPTMLGLVNGHFSYGTAEIILEPLAQELRWQITYHQVYAHNPDGIIAGKMDWVEYMGNLERGWLGNRPIADILIHFSPVTTDYDFGGNKLSVMQEFTSQLQVMMARYRTGNGSGAALVTPSTSCVQDSNQALYVTIQKITDSVASNSQIQTWLRQNPQHPQTQRFNQLIALGNLLEKDLAPLGIIRADWQQSVEEMAGTRRNTNALGDFFSGITTWRTLLPRPAFDRLARIFLDRGADLWLLRTNQVGGNDPDILPLAPNAPFIFGK